MSRRINVRLARNNRASRNVEPSHGEAFEKMDFKNGIKWMQLFKRIATEYDLWAESFVFDASYSGIDRIYLHRELVQSIRKNLKEWRYHYDVVIKSYEKLEHKQQQQLTLKSIKAC